MRTLTTFVVLAGLVFFLATAILLAHEAPRGWSYPLECCYGIDCRPAGRVAETPAGYQVPSGEVVPYGDTRLRDSLDSDFHWCTVGGTDDGKTLCLFVPPRGV